MKLNFTNSKDGVQRAVVRVEQRMAKDDLARALAVQMSKTEAFEDLPENMPASEVIRQVRLFLRDYGFDATWSEDVEPEYSRWAQRQIDRVVGDV